MLQRSTRKGGGWPGSEREQRLGGGSPAGSATKDAESETLRHLTE